MNVYVKNVENVVYLHTNEVLNAACILMKMKKNEQTIKKRCINCRINKSPVWRSINGNQFCNACGIHYKRFGVYRKKNI